MFTDADRVLVPHDHSLLGEAQTKLGQQTAAAALAQPVAKPARKRSSKQRSAVKVRSSQRLPQRSFQSVYR